MKFIKILRGSARGLRRIGLLRNWKLIAGASKMAPPSAESQTGMLADQRTANRKMSIALFQKHGTARMPF